MCITLHYNNCLTEAYVALYVAGFKPVSTEMFDYRTLKSAAACLMSTWFLSFYINQSTVGFVCSKWLGGLDAYLKGTKATKPVMHSSFKFIAGRDC